LAGSEADPAEVIDDLRRHIDAEVAAARLKVVTEDEVRRMISRLGTPDAAGLKPGMPEAAPTVPAVKGAAAARMRAGLVMLILGVVLPAVTLGIELATRMCASVFFDPIPSFLHVLLVAWVPLANGMIWSETRREPARYRPWLGWANGLAVGVAAFYTVLYLPLVAPGIVAIIWFGWGLLPLAPILSFLVALRCRRHLRELAVMAGRGDGPRGLWPGVGLAMLMLVGADLPDALTRVGLQLADSETAATRERGIQWLRVVGHQETLLRACYERPRRITDFAALFISRGNSLTPEEARRIYYRVTGQPFNGVPPPRLYSRSGVWNTLQEEFSWEFDTGLGGDAVAGRVRGLSLEQSRLDGIVEPDAAVTYVEWTMEFRNRASQAREARAQVLLPPGGVVSRLTLWVNGEEREAAFGGRGQVREAYQQVAVRQRRDPVLVTTCGPDRVLVQCFPVPANGGQMKIRLGITAPLRLSSLSQGQLRWPVFLERNFHVPEELRHSVWLESPGRLETPCGILRAESPQPGWHALRGELDDTLLGTPAAIVQVRRSPQSRELWTPANPPHLAIKQSLSEAPPSRVTRLALVVDGSRGMTEAYRSAADFVGRLPASLDFRVFLGTDEPIELGATGGEAASNRPQVAAASLRQMRGMGGQDNVPALVEAWDWATQTTNGVILWIHGPQPVLLNGLDALRQRMERRPDAVRLIVLQTKPGPNRLLEKLDGLPGLCSVPLLMGTLVEQLDLWATESLGQMPRIVFEREQAAIPPAGGALAWPPAAKHLERLWALEKIQRHLAARQTRAALELAAQYQLVTPVSGAVVLETQDQYDRAGLTPVDPQTVPFIPEPGTWVLLVLGGIVLGWGIRRQRPKAFTVSTWATNHCRSTRSRRNRSS
jgi:hypothetical protein